MDWGRLWEYPFIAEVWGTFGEFTGSIASFVAILAGVIYFCIERRNDIRSQASLIDCEIRDVWDVAVINRSEHSIVNVRVTGSVLSVWKAASIGEYDDAILFGNNWAPYPSIDFYRETRTVIRSMKSRGGELGGVLVGGEVLAGKTGTIRAARLDVGAYFWLRFRDVHGRDWKLDMQTKKLRRVRRWWKPHSRVLSRASSAWWILKSAAVVAWQDRGKKPVTQQDPVSEIREIKAPPHPFVEEAKDDPPQEKP